MNKTVFPDRGLESLALSLPIDSIGRPHRRFMTDSLGVGAAMPGARVAVSETYEAASDPAAGILRDRSRVAAAPAA